MELVCLGKVVKLHGYLGLMKISTKFDKGFNIKKIEKIYDEAGNEFAVNRIFQNTDAVVVGLEGVDLEKAKGYINKTLFIEREVVCGKILFEDLKGSNVVFADGIVVGKITDVQDYGSAEVISILTEKGKELMFPNVKGVIENFDYKTKILTINKQRFKEVSEYEDWYFNIVSRNVFTIKRKHFKAGNWCWLCWNKHHKHSWLFKR